MKNIYHMLAYAYQDLQHNGYGNLDAEDFDNVYDLLAVILARGTAIQLKHGLYKEYSERSEELPVLKGRIDIRNTVRLKIRRDNKLSCVYDELWENNLMNQVLKTAARYLILSNEVKEKNKDALKKLIRYFSDIEYITPTGIPWNRIQYHKNNQRYRILMNVCRMIFECLLPSDKKGYIKFAEFSDTQEMSRLYEKFILEYFKKHHMGLNANSGYIDWNAHDEDKNLLPKMKTDVTLTHNEHTLIIDAKYYSRTLLERYDKLSLRSSHLYQIFAYVKNADVQHSGKVSGMLLYAKTNEDVSPDCEYLMDGNEIHIKTLDLNMEFKEICAQLDSIAEGFYKYSNISSYNNASLF